MERRNISPTRPLRLPYRHHRMSVCLGRPRSSPPRPPIPPRRCLQRRRKRRKHPKRLLVGIGCARADRRTRKRRSSTRRPHSWWQKTRKTWMTTRTRRRRSRKMTLQRQRWAGENRVSCPEIHRGVSWKIISNRTTSRTRRHGALPGRGSTGVWGAVRKQTEEKKAMRSNETNAFCVQTNHCRAGEEQTNSVDEQKIYIYIHIYIFRLDPLNGEGGVCV